ncbi:uncharacterized protein (DUF1778 family) [Paraburkholderia sp. Clong3]|uniref:plasmid mobilization protein n=1 Tax=Paraburkholderia sp. Clong3 TaxID=2991061 RepID=UPI003D223D99
MRRDRRIVVQVTENQKRAIRKNAQRLGLSVSELMRQAAKSLVPARDPEDIAGLLDRVKASTRQAGAALDETAVFVAESNRRIEAMATRKGIL